MQVKKITLDLTLSEFMSLRLILQHIIDTEDAASVPYINAMRIIENIDR